MSTFTCTFCVVVPLGVTFYKRWMDTSSQRASPKIAKKKLREKYISLLQPSDFHDRILEYVIFTIQVSFTAEYFNIIYLLSKCLSRQNTIIYYIYYPSFFHRRILYVGDRWHVACIFRFLFPLLLSAQVKRFSVSRKRDL